MKNQKLGNRLIAFLISLAFVFQMAIPVFAETSVEPISTPGSLSVLDGLITITDTKGTGVVQDDVVTITVTGDGTAMNNDITIKNNSGYKAELKFAYNVENSLLHNGLDSEVGTYTAIVDVNAEVKVRIRAASGETATLTMSDFSLTKVSDNATVTVVYDPTMGSVSANGQVGQNGRLEISGVGANGVTLTAAPAAGATFAGWVDGPTNKFLSDELTYTYIPTGDASIRAIFTAPDKPAGFLIGGGLYDNLNDAIEYAESQDDYKTITLAVSGTLEKGETYIIPAGVKLLIPCI